MFCAHLKGLRVLRVNRGKQNIRNLLHAQLKCTLLFMCMRTRHAPRALTKAAETWTLLGSCCLLNNELVQVLQAASSNK